MKQKQQQLTEATDKVASLSKEREKLKAEVQMLRKAQKEIRDGSQVAKLEEENEMLVKRFNEQIEERKKEIEFWVSERANMRDRIEELENTCGMMQGDISHTSQEKSEQTKKQLEKLQKRIKTKDFDVKKLNSDLVDQKNEVAKNQIKIVELEAQLRDAHTQIGDSHERHNLLQSRLKEVEIEKEVILVRNKEVITENDHGQMQVANELD